MIKEFTDSKDADIITKSMTENGYTLKEVQNHANGNFLVFELSLAGEVRALKARIEKLEAR